MCGIHTECTLTHIHVAPQQHKLFLILKTRKKEEALEKNYCIAMYPVFLGNSFKQARHCPVFDGLQSFQCRSPRKVDRSAECPHTTTYIKLN